MTLPLPWTFSKDDPAGPDLENRLQEVFDVIATNSPDTGGRSLRIRAGSTSLTMAAAVAGTNPITHGLGTTPIFAVAIPDGTTANDLTIGTTTLTATTFTVTWRRASGALPPSPCTFYWLAIG